MDELREVTVLMMTYVLRNLPTALQIAWVCSAFSKGYCATKEMLQNGIPGHTLLLESGDLRDVDASSEGNCQFSYRLSGQSTKNFAYNSHIHSDVRRVSVYANVAKIPIGFLQGCTGLTALDLSPLSQITEVQWGFLNGCTGLTTLDLSPLSQITKVSCSFLQGCTGLTALDLSPLSQVIEAQGGFLEGCPGIKAVDNPPPLSEPPSGWSRAANQWVRE